jgi:viologen exporter family transport system permease protein
VKRYLALAKVAARAVTTYRMNFVLGQFALIFQLLAMLAIWRVLLASGHSVGGFDWPQMKAYLMVGFCSGVLVSMYADFRMAGRIRDGTVALDLTKPLDFQTARFAETLGGVWAEVVTAVIVCATVLLITGGIPVPGPQGAALFALSMLAVVPLKFLIVYAFCLACFYTQNYLGVYWARLAIVSLLSGALIPLSFYPGWLQGLAAVMPFASLASTPALIYLDRVDIGEALLLIGTQLAWVAVLWLATRVLFRGAVRQFTVHGG